MRGSFFSRFLSLVFFMALDSIAFQSQVPFNPRYRHSFWPDGRDARIMYSGRSVRSRGDAVSSTSLKAGLESSPAAALAILAGIILIHESGHYLAARLFGIKVEEFAVGVGPKLFGVSALGNEFNLRAIPLGGYVRFPENYNFTAMQELQDEAFMDAIVENSREVNQTLGFRIANAFTFGNLEMRRREARIQQQLAEIEEYGNLTFLEKLGKKSPEKELGVEEVEIQYDDNPDLLQNRPWPQRAVVISGGVVFNLLLSFAIYFGQIAGTDAKGLPSPVFEPGVKVSSIPQRTAAAQGVLRPGDVVMKANGVPLTPPGLTRPGVSQAQKSMNDLIAAIRATPDGGEVELEIIRGKGDFMETVRIQPKRASGPQSIGVLLTPNAARNQVLKSDNPFEAARLAWRYTWSLTLETATGLKDFLTQALVGNGNGGGSISGPIGLVRTGSEVVATKDLQTILLFAAAISVNLGVINAFPLPALDGGQLVFVLIEAITRRKVNQQFQEGITGFAVFLLLLVSLGAAVGDISSILGR